MAAIEPAFEFYELTQTTDPPLQVVLCEHQLAAQSIWQVPAYIFHLTVPPDPTPIGRVSLRIGFTGNCLRYAGQVGFRVDELHRGHGYAGRAVKLILPLASRHGMTELWLTANPDNTASRRVIEKLGGQYVETVDVPADYPGDGRQKCRYRLVI